MNTRNDQQTKRNNISKAIYQTLPWLYSYNQWLHDNKIFLGGFFNPLTFKNRNHPLNAEEFKKYLLLMFSIIYDCSTNIYLYHQFKYELQLHNKKMLDHLLFKMLTVDLGWGVNDVTDKEIIEILSFVQISGFEDVSENPHVEIYEDTKKQFYNLPVFKLLCEMHEEITRDINQWDSTGFNKGSLKMCLLYDLIRRVLLTLQMNCYPKGANVLLGNDKVPKTILLSDDRSEGLVFMLRHGKAREVCSSNESKFNEMVRKMNRVVGRM